MSTQHYALLVGIDKYLDTSVPKLDAPKYDVQKMADYLSSLSNPNFSIQTLLVNGENKPTRENIITFFKQHLIENAAPGVILLFYFSGHGSTEIADDLFVQYQGSRFNETLICYDSRTDGIWDLSDKELKWLIHQAAEKQAEVVFILDSCHSGSATRFSGEEQIWKFRNVLAPAVKTSRPLHSYLEGSTTYRGIPRHVLLGACKKDQRAIEIKGNRDGEIEYTGLFTSKLLSILSNSSEPISYRDLMSKCRLFVQRTYPLQVPNLEAFDYFDTYRYFLNLETQTSNQYTYQLFLEKPKNEPPYWIIQFGISNGMPYDTQQMATFQLFADKQLTTPLGKARVTAVGLNESRVELSFQEDNGLLPIESCYGIATFLPLDKLSVCTNITPEELAAQQKAVFENAYDIQWMNNIVDWSFGQNNAAEFFLEFKNQGTCTLGYVDTGEVIFPKKAASAPFKIFKDVFSRIESWQRYEQITQPVHFSIFEEKGYFPGELIIVSKTGEKKQRFSHNKLSEAKEITLDFPGDYGQVYKNQHDIIDYTIELTNNTEKLCLYLYLLNFDLRYKITSLYNDKIEPSPNPKTLKISHYDDDLQKSDLKVLYLPPGKNQDYEGIKLFISEDSFENFLMEQKGLSALESQTRFKGAREFDHCTQKPLSNWYTQSFNIKILRELGTVGSSPIQIPHTPIEIQSHATFKAKVSLISTARSMRSHNLDYHLAEVAQQLEIDLIDFSTQGRKETLLELHHMENQHAICTEHPLTIFFDIPYTSGDRFLAITLPTKETELFVPIAELHPNLEGRLELNIKQIVPNSDDGRFEAKNSMKIAIFRLRKERLSSVLQASG